MTVVERGKERLFVVDVDQLAAAILDETKVAALEDEPLWKAARPIPLSVAWSEIVKDEPAR